MLVYKEILVLIVLTAPSLHSFPHPHPPSTPACHKHDPDHIRVPEHRERFSSIRHQGGRQDGETTSHLYLMRRTLLGNKQMSHHMNLSYSPR